MAKGKLERLNEKLNSQTRYQNPEDTREVITEPEGEGASESWVSPNLDELISSDRRAVETHPVVKKIFLAALLFFICAVGAAALIYFKGDNFVSTKNLDIAVNGPISVSAGSTVDLEVTITNKNNTALDTVNLNITYPEGARSAEDSTKAITDTKEVLKALGAGEKVTKNEQVVFFGKEGEVKTVHIAVDYKVQGSNAIFTKEKNFALTIASAPVSMAITHPESVVSGEAFNIVLDIHSNAKDILKNVIVKAEYPYGWSFVSASPIITDTGKGIWSLGNLSPGDKKTINLRGILVGEDNDERTLRFFVGVGKSGGTVIDTTLSGDSLVMSIKRPLLDIGVKLNGDSRDEYAVPAGKPITAIFTFKNNLLVGLQNPQIEVRLTGSALDKSSVVPVGGSFNSSNGSVVWSQNNSENLKTLAPGESGTVSMSFATLGTLPASSGNKEVDLSVIFSGKAQDTSANISITNTRVIKVASEVALSSKSLYSRGPFKNIGAIPPKALAGTTYTIDLILGNTQNDIENSVVTGKLGANVKWLGETSPEGSGLTYDEGTKLVTWNVGTLPSGAGFSSPARETFFRVELDPSLGQVGGVPVLLSDITFVGTDTFTKNTVKVVNPAVTTKISTDPRYVQGDETVVK